MNNRLYTPYADYQIDENLIGTYGGAIPLPDDWMVSTWSLDEDFGPAKHRIVYAWNENMSVDAMGYIEE